MFLFNFLRLVFPKVESQHRSLHRFLGYSLKKPVPFGGLLKHSPPQPKDIWASWRWCGSLYRDLPKALQGWHKLGGIVRSRWWGGSEGTAIICVWLLHAPKGKTERGNPLPGDPGLWSTSVSLKRKGLSHRCSFRKLMSLPLKTEWKTVHYRKCCQLWFFYSRTEASGWYVCA